MGRGGKLKKGGREGKGRETEDGRKRGGQEERSRK